MDSVDDLRFRLKAKLLEQVRTFWIAFALWMVLSCGVAVHAAYNLLLLTGWR
jgi:hypothetical protein